MTSQIMWRIGQNLAKIWKKGLLQKLRLWEFWKIFLSSLFSFGKPTQHTKWISKSKYAIFGKYSTEKQNPT